MPDCSCGSLLDYPRCCEPLHNGQVALSAQALMRSRYSAFVLGLSRYLLSSWHISTRPDRIELDNTQWLRLEVISHSEQGNQGEVRFKAFFKEGADFWVLEESSNFIKENGHWFYVDGLHSTEELKPRRNDACPCGSGKKFKKCCGTASHL